MGVLLLYINAYGIPLRESFAMALRSSHLCPPNLCWASSKTSLCGGEDSDVSYRKVREGPCHAAMLSTDSTRPTWLPGCCYCCWWSTSDILSELSQAWIIGSWNQLKYEPADEGSCCSLNCSLTVKKSICGRVLLPSRRERWPAEQLAVSREHQFSS